MKKFIVGLSLIMIAMASFGQVAKTATQGKVFKLLYEKDKMTDEEYLQPNWNLIAKKTEKTGFLVKLDFTKTDSSVWAYNGLTIIAAGIGGCHEDDYLIILFDDGSKIKTTMWNKFNCSGDVYLDWDKEFENDLRTKSIKTIRLTNGRSFDSHEITYTKLEDKNYFITYFKKLDEFNLRYQSIVKK